MANLFRDWLFFCSFAWKNADTVLDNLAVNYVIDADAYKGFILGHSTGHHPAGSEINVPLVYADYYFLEAMARRRTLRP